MKSYFLYYGDVAGNKVSVEKGCNERMLRVTLEIDDHYGILDDEGIKGLGEGFFEQELVVRESDFSPLVKVLNYNSIKYRVETLT